MKRLCILLLILNYLTYFITLAVFGLAPENLVTPVHNARVEYTLTDKETIVRDPESINLEPFDIEYEVENYATDLAEQLTLDREGNDRYNDTSDLLLRGLVFVPGNDHWGQIYQPIYEGASNKVLYFGAGTTHPHRYMGVNHFTTIGHNMNDSHQSMPSFYSAMQDYTYDIQGTRFWSTDGIKIYEWIIDASFYTKFDQGWIQDLDAELPGAHVPADKHPRFTLITCLVDASYFTRRPEWRIVASGYLNGERYISEDPKTALKLFPDLAQFIDVDEMSGLEGEALDSVVQATEHTKEQNERILWLFQYHPQILVGWGIVNACILVVLFWYTLSRK